MIAPPKLGHIFGLRLQLHHTWIFAFAWATAVIVTQFPEAYPLWQRIIFGIVAGLLFFTGISIREFILSFLAASKGMPFKRVRLFVFGGVPQIAKESTLPSIEMLLAVAGLISNLAIIGLFYVSHVLLVRADDVVLAALTQWVAYIYFMLALFHFLPVFPLDVGRILRALLWQTTGNYYRVTRIATWTGWGTGLLCITGGILLLINTGQWSTGLLLALIGWVLLSTSAQSRHQATLHQALQGITAGEIISQECSLINEQLSLSELVHDCILVTTQRYFVVADGHKLRGVVTMPQIKSVSKNRWSSTRAGEIMTPASQLTTADAQQSAASLLEQMEDWEIDHIPVVENDDVIGIIARDSLLRFGKTRAEFGI